MSTDELRRFHFERAPVRGMWVRLNRVWFDAIHNRPYQPEAKKLLGEMLAMIVLIANNIKHDGGVTLHAVGNGPVKTAFAECRKQNALRGIVRMNEDDPQPIQNGMNFKDLLGEARMALTMQFASGESYQGLVDTTHLSLERNMEHYFENSEQLETAIALCTIDSDAVTGCFLQRLPSDDLASDIVVAHDEAEWIRLVSLFRTLREGELGDKSAQGLLRDLFPHDSIRLSEATTIHFECTCTRERCAEVLKTMAASDLAELLADRNSIEVNCEFCGFGYTFAEADVAALKS